MFTPFLSSPFVQEFLLIHRRGVASFEDSFFKRLSSPISQVSLTFVLGRLESSRRHVFGDRNLGGCVLDMLGLGGGFPFFLVGSFAFLPFY